MRNFNYLWKILKNKASETLIFLVKSLHLTNNYLKKIMVNEPVGNITYDIE